MTSRENPGPGTYQITNGFDADKESLMDGSAGTYPFTSGTVMTHQQAGDEKSAPGPGHYEVQGHLEISLKQSRTKGQQSGDRSQFGSMTERIGWARSVTQPFKDPYNLHHVPGPGHYQAHGKDPRKKEAEKALPRNQ